LNNFFTVREVLKQYPAEVIRYFLLSSQYRSAINYSEENLQTAFAALTRFYNALKGINSAGASPAANTEFEKRFHAAMEDDFNTPEALSALFDIARESNRLRASDVAASAALAALLRKLGGMLGILQTSAEDFLRSGAGNVDAAHVEVLIAGRKAARDSKNWAEADRIRDELKALNVVVEDKGGVTTWRIEKPA
jgi:cysteinyl-tRNA synthetase